MTKTYVYDEPSIAFNAPGHEFIFAGEQKDQIPVLGKTNEMLTHLASQQVHELEPIPLRKIHINDRCEVEIHNGSIKAFAPTATGLQSVCEFVPAINYSGVRMDIDQGMFDWIHPMNERFDNSDSYAKPIIRDGRLAALRSPSFALTTNYDIAKDSIARMPDGYQFLGGFLSPYKFKMVFINADKEIVLSGDSHMPGFVQFNSEVGSNALSLEWMLYTAFCTNMALLGGHVLGGTRMIHRGNLNERVDTLLRNFIPKADEINAFFARALPVLETTSFAENGAFLKTYSEKLRAHLGKKRTETFLQNREANNYFHEWSRLTSHARDMKDIDKRTKLEEIGGWMLSYVDKNSHKIRANKLN